MATNGIIVDIQPHNYVKPNPWNQNYFHLWLRQLLHFRWEKNQLQNI